MENTPTFNPVALIQRLVPFTGYRPDAKYQTRDGFKTVEIWEKRGNCTYPIAIISERNGSRTVEVRRADGTSVSGGTRYDDVMELTLAFPQAPAGETWHNPEGWSPEVIGVGYRLLLSCEFNHPEFMEKVEYHYTENEARRTGREPGWFHFGTVQKGDKMYAHITYRVPDTTPFMLPVPVAVSVECDVPDDSQLKRVFAAILPEWCCMEDGEFLVWNKTDLENGIQKDNQVFGAQLLHLCSLAEQEVVADSFHGRKKLRIYRRAIAELTEFPEFATWQQRAVALAGIKGIEV